MNEKTDIRELRKRRGWSQSDLAERIGCDRSTVSRLESGTQTPRGAVMILLRQLLEETGSDQSAGAA